MIFFLPLISSTQQSARHIVDAQCIFSNENIDVSFFPNYINNHPLLQTPYLIFLFGSYVCVCVCVFIGSLIYALNETLRVVTIFLFKLFSFSSNISISLEACSNCSLCLSLSTIRPAQICCNFSSSALWDFGDFGVANTLSEDGHKR